MTPFPPPPGSKNILIVDDVAVNLRLLADLLMQHGYTVRPAINGRSALKVVERVLPDLILLDIIMPDMSGYDVCRALKARERTRAIPVIFISALHEVVDKVKAFESGGVDFITKPFQEEEVLARVRTHLTLHHLRQEIQQQTARFQMLSEAASEAIVIHDGERITDVNRTCEAFFGYCRDELLNIPVPQLFSDACRELAAACIHNADQPPYEAVGVRCDGSQFPIEAQTRRWNNDAIQTHVTTIRDISRQKAIEEENRHLHTENTALKSSLQARYRFGDIIGKSQAMQALYELILNAAASDHNVAIYGESGTGKELVARTIHAMSARREGAFIPVNCGAIAEPLFEREFFGHRKSAFTGADQDQPGFFDAAHQGILFLDEVGELSPAMQVKLLRAIETGEYIPVGDNSSKHADIRIISATNRRLDQLLHQGLLRDDFFYRLHVIEIHIPPLRERKDDIPLLIEHVLQELYPDGERQRLPSSIAEQFYAYDWPGNIRELQNKLKRYLSTGQVQLSAPLMAPETAPGRSDGGDERQSTLHAAVEALERRMISEALAYNHWHKGNTAKMLAIPRKTLQRKIAKYNL